ncbi:MbtH family NRPS accessory protein [Saccharomonospora sp. NB11]|uniref:MbtH family protein n=1 Tax=Saccharomonospora sp. NB11 TaxID=1642298 RepID=UPI0018D12C89|nr:MbtH family NRPS accessory protein [Saccharomonospora sp. NB11]
MSEQTDNTGETRYHAVVNDEEQYSIWPAHRELPAGWHETGVSGSKEDCLDHIERVWTDMRPKSLRERMAAHNG